MWKHKKCFLNPSQTCHLTLLFCAIPAALLDGMDQTNDDWLRGFVYERAGNDWGVHGELRSYLGMPRTENNIMNKVYLTVS